MAEIIQPALVREHSMGGDPPESAAIAQTSIALLPPTFIPRRYKPRNVGEWTGHLTFASDLIVALQPSLIVELGTHWGEAYYTFCQTVQEHGLSCLCYAVDHWLGDEHAGHYGEEVFEEVGRYNERFYRQFSYLLRRSFDDALTQFADASISLLHIDGLHTYDAVTHDFRNWLPKVKPGGFVLLHDICPRHQDFGVWRLWDEIKSEFPDTFEFHHSWGLGVLRKQGGDRKTPLEELLFNSSPAVQEDVRRHYVIYASHLEHLLGRMPAIPAPRVEVPSEIRVEVFPGINGGHFPEFCQVRKMKAGSWNTLVFEFRGTNFGAPLRIDPGCEPSFIEVGDIQLYSTDTGELLWNSPASSEDRSLHLGGTALPHPNNPSFIINVGDDPIFLLTTIPELRGPFSLSIALKVTPVNQAVMEIIHRNLQNPLLDAAQKLTAAQEERNAVAAELAAVKVDLIQVVSARNLELAELNKLQQALVQVENSASWRVTSPMRKLMSVLRTGKL